MNKVTWITYHWWKVIIIYIHILNILSNSSRQHRTRSTSDGFQYRLRRPKQLCRGWKYFVQFVSWWMYPHRWGWLYRSVADCGFWWKEICRGGLYCEQRRLLWLVFWPHLFPFGFGFLLVLSLSSKVIVCEVLILLHH